MALYIDSAYLDDIIAVSHMLPLAGVTTNPTILLKARERGQELSPQDLLKQLLDQVGGKIFMQPSLADEKQALQDVLAMRWTAPDRVIPKIPMTPRGLRLAQELKHRGHHVAFTAVTTVSQAYIAAEMKAAFIIPYYNRLQRSGVDAAERIRQIAHIFAYQRLSTRILVASLKTPEEADQALFAGAHDLTVPPDVLLAMTTNPASEEAVARFEQDYQKMKDL
jgi:TalC/MipB family fructose-6-phosphate aldolase